MTPTAVTGTCSGPCKTYLEDFVRARARLSSEGRLCNSVDITGLALILPDVISTIACIRRQCEKQTQLCEPKDVTAAILLFVESCLRAVLPRAFVL